MYTTQNLVDSQGNDVGDVQVTIVGNSVIVTIVAAPNVTLEEVYVYVGTSGVPLNGSGAVDIPAFPFIVTNVNDSSISYTTTVCIDACNGALGAKLLLISIHAVTNTCGLPAVAHLSKCGVGVVMAGPL